MTCNCFPVLFVCFRPEEESHNLKKHGHKSRHKHKSKHKHKKYSSKDISPIENG